MLDLPPMSTGQIGEYCGVHIRTVIRWIEQGMLQAHRLPGKGDYRVQPGDFLQFLENHQIPIREPFIDRSRRVLIAEDDGLMARGLQRTIESAGFSTQVAANGLQAGLLLGSFQPVLITLDLLMPGMHGQSVLELITRDDRLRGTRILVVSGMPPDELDMALDAGADDVLRKPFEPDELIEKVQRLTGVKRAEVPEPIWGRAGT